MPQDDPVPHTLRALFLIWVTPGRTEEAPRANPSGVVLTADILSIGLDRIIAVDLHKPTLEGFFSVPVEHLSAIELIADALKQVSSE
jgi:phosphoribosylpyrophosphate synthetase